jgi:hypothetical protein
LGKRTGDNAELAMIELVDYNEIYGKGIGEKEAPAKRTRRAGRGKKSQAKQEETDKPVEDVKVAEAKKPAEKAKTGATEKPDSNPPPVESPETEVPVEEPDDAEPEVKA